MEIRKLVRTFEGPVLGGLCLVTLCLLGAACAHRPSSGAPPAPPADADVNADTDADTEVPITSASPEAVELYRQARDLSERLRNTEAHELFARAVAKDPDFALAHLGMAETSPTTGEFFESLERAVALADRVSEAERWIILGRQATVDGDVEAQRRYYRQLVERYPGDERARVLIALHHFGRQELEPALEHLDRAVALDPGYAPAYNLLGYAHQLRGDTAAAEEALRRYVELLPTEANPYDSYAGLLVKVGRFEEAIANYRQALERDPDFFFSRLGIGTCYTLLGRYDEARATFQEAYDRVDTDGQRRRALLGKVVSYLHQEDYDSALAEVRKRYALAAAAEDRVAMFDDLVLTGNVLIGAGDADRAEASFRRAVATVGEADVGEEYRATARRNLAYHLARVALVRGDLETAAAKAEEYRATAKPDLPVEAGRSHELAGRIALERGDPETALRELSEADQEDPRILYFQALAWRARGDREKTRELAKRAADYNDLDVGYALVRGRAQRLLAE